MINEHSINTLKTARFGERFLRPVYDSYSFSRIPATLQLLLGAPAERPMPSDTCLWEKGGYDQVVMILIDGFGWRFWETYHHRYSFLERFLKQGVVNQISAQFPSTTAAHVTCLNTGKEVGQIGLYEWFHFDPEADRVVAPLLSSYAGDKQANTLGAWDQWKSFYPAHTFYQTLHEQGVDSHVFQMGSICSSLYSQSLLKGSTCHPFDHFEEGLQHMTELIGSFSNGKQFFSLYHGEIDAAAHRKGVASRAFEDSVLHTFDALESWWKEISVQKHRKVALIITADHGMVDIDPEKTLYLNKTYPQLLPDLLKTQAGQVIAPCGSSRDFFLHIRPERLDYWKQFFKNELSHMAEVHLVEDLIGQGFFGELPVSANFRNRVGNLVLLPFNHESIWWYEKHRFEQNFYGMHGGLTPEEMQTIFLFLPLQ